MVVLEAMAFGLPVVVSNAEYCGISALLKHCKNALLLRNPLDAEEVAQMVSMVLVSSELRTGLGQQARSFAECFDWRKLAIAQEAIYFDAVKGISNETSNNELEVFAAEVESGGQFNLAHEVVLVFFGGRQVTRVNL